MTKINALIFSALTLCATAAHAEVPEGGSVTIEDFSHGGNGCPQGSVAANISPDNQAMTLLFDSYVVDSTETESAVDRKNCQINVKLKTPPGWKYSLFCIDFRGYADLSAGATGLQMSSVRFGQSHSAQLGRFEMKGPLVLDYTNVTAVPLSAVPWSNCGNGGGSDVLTIDTEAQVSTLKAPDTTDLQLASSRGRLVKQDLGRQVLKIELLRKHSASPCREGHSYGSNGSTVWAKFGCRADFRVTLAPDANAGSDAQGLLTVDSIDGHVKHHYGLAWQRCGQGSWEQSDGNKSCGQVCSQKGKRLARDPSGAQCASGEARPESAIGQINFVKGCWGGCTSQGNITTDALGLMCYQPGQRRDNDKTDQAVGCYCE